MPSTPRCHEMPHASIHACLDDELEAGVAGVELDEQPDAQGGGEHAGQQPDQLDELGPAPADEGHGQRAGDGRQRRATVRIGNPRRPSTQRIPLTTTNQASSTTTPMPMIPA